MGGEFEALAEWLRAVGAVDLANVGGLFAALAGIWLTFLQLLMFRRQLKLDALIRIMDSNRAIVSLGFDHPVVWAAMEEGTGAASGDESMAHRRYRQLWMNHMQIMWSAWRLGLVSGFEWEAYRQDMAEFLRARSLREHWGQVSRFYPRGFRRLVTELSGPKQDSGATGPG
jgi:hypothetical protein